MRQEELRWYQKSRINWISFGKLKKIMLPRWSEGGEIKLKHFWMIKVLGYGIQLICVLWWFPSSLIYLQKRISIETCSLSEAFFLFCMIQRKLFFLRMWIEKKLSQLLLIWVLIKLLVWMGFRITFFNLNGILRAMVCISLCRVFSVADDTFPTFGPKVQKLDVVSQFLGLLALRSQV